MCGIIGTAALVASNKYVGANNAYLAGRLAERTLNNSVPYIIPVLDALHDGFTFLDVGCGPGSITIDIARRFPSATILGLDSGTDAIAMARANARIAGVTNVHFEIGDGLNLAAASNPSSIFDIVLNVNGGFDVVHTHQLHMHVQDASKLMCELRAAAKPSGGLVCCRESDHGMVAFWPEKESMKQFVSAIPMMLLGRGQDPYVGRKFVSHALAAGCKRENMEASVGTWVYSTPEERREWAEVIVGSIQSQKKSDQIRNEAATSGSRGMDMSQGLRDWEDWVQAEDGWYAVPCPRIICRRHN
ncbi:S-adenosyl-L-methionine-dependent methyltransferase [Colletotrichum caudatum]|nr:S-adenosyl-L-methionine-dependent methyltransferase [Colletotrichum caudatum]